MKNRCCFRCADLESTRSTTQGLGSFVSFPWVRKILLNRLAEKKNEDLEGIETGIPLRSIACHIQRSHLCKLQSGENNGGSWVCKVGKSKQGVKALSNKDRKHHEYWIPVFSPSATKQYFKIILN